MRNLLCIRFVAFTQDDLDRAEAYYQQALGTELGRKEEMANQLDNLGLVAEQRGDMIEACRLWREARDLFQVIGMPHMVGKHQGFLDEVGCVGDASGGS